MAIATRVRLLAFDSSLRSQFPGTEVSTVTLGPTDPELKLGCQS